MDRNPTWEPPLIVALDVGSSSIRVLAFDRLGRMVKGLHAEIEHQVRTTADGGAVLDADEVVRRTLDCLRALHERKQFKPWRRHIAAVSCSMFMHSLVGVNRANRACTPLYMWSDTRSREALLRHAPTLDPAAVHQRTGCPLHTSYPLAKLLWLRRARPGLFRRVRRWLSMGDYLHLRLFGRPSLGYSMASGTGLFDFRRLRWDPSLLATAGLRAEQLGELAKLDQRPDRTVHAGLRDGLGPLAEAPWFPVVGDAVCSNLGSGCADDSRLALNLGTSGAMRAVFRDRVPRIPEGLFCYVVDKRRRLVGGAISNCGNLRRWLIHTLQVGKRSRMEKTLALMAPDAHGLTVLPFLAGERAPFWPNDATGVIAGLRSATSAVDIARAGFEAVGYQLALIHERVSDVVPRARRIVASGGGSASDWWMQMMADTMGTPVVRSTVTEASSRGAALLALEALGMHAEAQAVPTESDDVFVPNAGRETIYRRALERYRKAVRAYPGSFFE